MKSNASGLYKLFPVYITSLIRNSILFCFDWSRSYVILKDAPVNAMNYVHYGHGGKIIALYVHQMKPLQIKKIKLLVQINIKFSC